VRAVSYGRGPDAATIARFRKAGVLCMPTVGALRHALKAIELGADIITVQGAEGGGHTGSVPTTILLPQVLSAATVPVVAAGGFFDGRGLAGALAYGAAGIAMGTRFLLTAESPVPRATLERYLKVVDAAQIRVTTAVDGLPHRMIETPLMRSLEQGGALRRLWTALASAWKWKARTGMSLLYMVRTALQAVREGDAIAQTLMAANAPVLIQRAMVEGQPDEGVLPSGQVAAAISDLPTVGDLIERIAMEAEQRLAALGAPTPTPLPEGEGKSAVLASPFGRGRAVGAGEGS
jgi:nitronate monooxygenase